MPKVQKRERWNEIPPYFSSAGELIHGQNLAVQNVTRMTGQVCHQVMSMNKAWFNLWRRFTNAQVDYIGDVLSSFEETGREMGKLVLHAEVEAGDTLQKNAEEARRSIREGMEAQEQAASALHSSINTRRQKNEGGKGRRTEQSGQDRAH
jgi:hypothetical protein